MHHPAPPLHRVCAQRVPAQIDTQSVTMSAEDIETVKNHLIENGVKTTPVSAKYPNNNQVRAAQARVGAPLGWGWPATCQAGHPEGLACLEKGGAWGRGARMPACAPHRSRAVGASLSCLSQRRPSTASPCL